MRDLASTFSQVLSKLHILHFTTSVHFTGKKEIDEGINEEGSLATECHEIITYLMCIFEGVCKYLCEFLVAVAQTT